MSLQLPSELMLIMQGLSVNMFYVMTTNFDGMFYGFVNSHTKVDGVAAFYKYIL